MPLVHSQSCISYADLKVSLPGGSVSDGEHQVWDLLGIPKSARVYRVVVDLDDLGVPPWIGKLQLVGVAFSRKWYIYILSITGNTHFSLYIYMEKYISSMYIYRGRNIILTTMIKYVEIINRDIMEKEPENQWDSSMRMKHIHIAGIHRTNNMDYI